MQVATKTHMGLTRPNNQDAAACGLFETGGAWTVVCDGMGGVGGGEIASSVALAAIKNVLLSGFSEEMSLQDTRTLLLNSIGRANAEVYTASLNDQSLYGMGTTAVVLLAAGGYLHVAHVGDSRAYLRSKKGLAPITVDHSFVQDLVNFGQITPEQARIHPKRNIITRVVGVRGEVQCDYSCFEFSPEDLAIACTDGLTMYADDDTLKELIDNNSESCEGLTQALVDFSLKSGGSDNVTVAVIKND